MYFFIAWITFLFVQVLLISKVFDSNPEQNRSDQSIRLGNYVDGAMVFVIGTSEQKGEKKIMAVLVKRASWSCL